MPDQKGGPHADVAADALVRLKPFDAAHPFGGIAGFVVAVRGEVIGRLNRQIPIAGDPQKIGVECVVPEVRRLVVVLPLVGLHDVARCVLLE